MNPEQAVPALICALIHAGVAPEVIEEAVSFAASLKLGDSVSSGYPLVRAFAAEQTRLLELASWPEVDESALQRKTLG